MAGTCSDCGSYAINHHCHGRDGSDGNLCDVCYWRKRAVCRDELLAVLEAWFEHEYGYGIGPTYDEVKAIIAKAKGE